MGAWTSADGIRIEPGTLPVAACDGCMPCWRRVLLIGPAVDIIQPGHSGDSRCPRLQPAKLHVLRRYTLRYHGCIVGGVLRSLSTVGQGSVSPIEKGGKADRRRAGWKGGGGGRRRDIVWRRGMGVAVDNGRRQFSVGRADFRCERNRHSGPGRQLFSEHIYLLGQCGERLRWGLVHASTLLGIVTRGGVLQHQSDQHPSCGEL
mmetsp:Transcript_3897/g.11198  ORF Transcript_3897/g.11198 Transcript_3897/m.11198 type:complete len:204 (+) Transcript_3897:1043-1654(+)